jgi:hypothetical protein
VQAICGLIRNWAYPRYSLFVFSFLYFVILGVMVMVFNATFNNISVILWFIGGGNWSTRRKPPTSRKSLINFIRVRCFSIAHLFTRIEFEKSVKFLHHFYKLILFKDVIFIYVFSMNVKWPYVLDKKTH